MFEVSLQGWDKTSKMFGSGKEAVAKAEQRMLDMATLMVQGKAKELAPVDKSTLRKSIARKVESGVGRVGSNVEYAPHQEFGTGIYGKSGSPIFPKRARMLSWVGKDGIRRFAKSVVGVKPRKFLQGGLEELKSRIGSVITAGRQELFKQLRG